MSLITKIQSWNNQRQTRKVLSKLSQRQLQDIGVSRDGHLYTQERAINI